MCLPARSSPLGESCPSGGDTTTASPCWACQRGSLPLGACPGPTQPGTSQGKPVRFLGSESGFYLPTGVSHPPSSAVLIIKMISGFTTPFSSIFSCSKLGYRSTLSQIHILSAQIFPPPHTFCSFQKQGRGQTCFFQELEESICIPSFHCGKEEEEKTVTFLLVLYSVSELHSQQQYCHQSISQKLEN